MKNRTEANPFGDSMRIFLDYIDRQARKNPDYKAHPLIRAFECALQGVDKLENGQCTLGFSGDNANGAVYNPFIVVLQKEEKGVGVKEIRNIQVDKTIPFDVMITIFRLQIWLDKVEGDTVSPDQMVEGLNAVIPGNKFYALGDRWIEARDKFKELIEAGKIHIPSDELAEDLKKIKYDTPWEEYPNRLRAFIGGAVATEICKDGGGVIITSPKDSKIEKVKVSDHAIEFLIGRSAEYLNPSQQKKQYK